MLLTYGEMFSDFFLNEASTIKINKKCVKISFWNDAATIQYIMLFEHLIAETSMAFFLQRSTEMPLFVRHCVDSSDMHAAVFITFAK